MSGEHNVSVLVASCTVHSLMDARRALYGREFWESSKSFRVLCEIRQAIVEVDAVSERRITSNLGSELSNLS